jgi:hypothetical protein
MVRLKGMDGKRRECERMGCEGKKESQIVERKNLTENSATRNL